MKFGNYNLEIKHNMSDIKLFSIENDNVKDMSEADFKLEKQVQNLVKIISKLFLW